MTKENPVKKLRGLPIVGVVILGIIFFVAIFADFLAPFPITQIDVARQLEGPSSLHWLGTDENGKDVLSLMLHGARVACLVGLSVVGFCSILGTTIGCISGYFGGWVDEVIMRGTETLMAFPGILLAILVIFVTQEPSILAVIGALSITGWAGYARLVRAQVLAEREREYVEAAKSLGFGNVRIMVREIIPNILGPVIVQATFGVAGAILAEASLSFLGLGPQDAPSWGALLDQGASYFLLTPHLAIFPGLAIMFTVLGINFLGDGLRDWLDPRQLRSN